MRRNEIALLSAIAMSHQIKATGNHECCKAIDQSMQLK